MTQIAILTPDPADSSYSGQWPGVLERLQAALSGAGVTAMPTPWVDHIEDASGLKSYPLILPVLVWGYHRDHARFMQATRTWTEAGLPLANPASVLGWNSDKSYLGRLAERGVPFPRRSGARPSPPIRSRPPSTRWAPRPWWSSRPSRAGRGRR